VPFEAYSTWTNNCKEGVSISNVIKCPLAKYKKLSRYRYAGDKEERMHSSYSFLTSALDGVSGQRHALAPVTHWIGGWVVWTYMLLEKLFLLLGIKPRLPGCAVCSQTLY
jgi:hypothetical protein